MDPRISGADQHWPTPCYLSVDVREERPDATVIYVRGELDRASAPALASRLHPLLDADPPRPTLILDLTATTFLDAGGLNLLLDVQQRATARGTRFGLAGCGPQVMKVLRVTETAELIPQLPAHHSVGVTAVPGGSGSTAHTDLPSPNSVTPQRVESADTMCNPRPRPRRGSAGRGRAGGQG
jgi:anti-sigma B factor antagonist